MTLADATGIVRESPRRLREVLWNSLALLTLTHTTLAEFWSSTTLLLLGAMFLDPFPTLLVDVQFDAHLLAVMPERSWGLLLFSVGIGQSISNVFRISYGRQFCAFAAMAVFFPLAFLGMATHPMSKFAAVFGTAAIAESLIYVSLSLARHQRRLELLREAMDADSRR